MHDEDEIKDEFDPIATDDDILGEDSLDLPGESLGDENFLDEEDDPDNRYH